MGLKAFVLRIIGFCGYSVHKIPSIEDPDVPVVAAAANVPVPAKADVVVPVVVDAGNEQVPADSKVAGVYDQDGLYSIHNHDFMEDLDFCKAYERGVLASGTNYKWHWRVHVGLWAAFNAAKLKGDFVECGVNYGFLSSSIMEYLNWDSLGKRFYLLDTFSGLDKRFDADDVMNTEAAKEFYVDGVDAVRRNFSQWKNIAIVVGSIPETLSEIDSDAIAYLHIDMNSAPPEVAAFDYLWERLVPGAFVLLDDYAYRGYEEQKHAMDIAAARLNVKVLSLPTGQGLIIKPVSSE